MGTCGPLGGECPAGLSCEPMTGQCVCLPDCGSRVCGPVPNGCGTSCGTCSVGAACTTAGACEATCGTSQCAGRNCGEDPGCPGQFCGTCLAVEICYIQIGLCYDPGTYGQGRPCAFGQVNSAAGACEAGLECLGAPPDPSAPCDTDLNCLELIPHFYNPDCVDGACGISLCAAPCGVGGTCYPGFWPQSIGGTCYCIPGTSGPDPNRPGEPCAFSGGVNGNVAGCAHYLECLGLPPDPDGMPCEKDDDCRAYLSQSWNPDCVNGGCGASFCSELCVQGACDAGFDPYIISGNCYCIPMDFVDDSCRLPGCPCPFTGGVNHEADNCVASFTCLGIEPDPDAMPCARDPDCIEYLSQNWNFDCVDGACGASFCAAECNNGACTDGFVPLDVQGICYCIPGQTGGGQQGDPCPFTHGVNSDAEACATDLTCLGIGATFSQPACPGGDADCLNSYPSNYNPDCVNGRCGVSFCSQPCSTGRTCDPGYTAQDIGTSGCYCIPTDPDT
jgi:hypothetical protein